MKNILSKMSKIIDTNFMCLSMFKGAFNKNNDFILGPIILVIPHEWDHKSQLLLSIENESNKGQTFIQYNDDSLLILSNSIGIKKDTVPMLSDGYVFWESAQGKCKTNGTHIIVS